MPRERVTITLPPDVIRAIDALGRNRSKFILAAVRRELDRRRREALQRSLANPHPESAGTAELGLDEWKRRLPEGDEALVDPSAGVPVRWTAGEGWIKVEE